LLPILKLRPRACNFDTHAGYGALRLPPFLYQLFGALLGESATTLSAVIITPTV
jgi:hypothetical protein